MAASGLSGAQCQGLVGPENADRRRAERGGDVQEAGIVGDRHRRGRQRENGVAQIVAGEVAGLGVADDLGGKRLLIGTAQDPNGEAVVDQAAGEGGISGAGPAL